MKSITPYERFGEPNPSPDAEFDEYLFRAGDTLSGVAHHFYDDWRAWRVIADKNSIVDVRIIPIGTRLLIPPRPLQSGRYEST
jgi:nucleoid-associated protein YgaU